MDEASDIRWRGLYRAGGVAAFVIAALLVGEVVVYALVPRASTAAQHFALFQDSPLLGLLSLDLLGMVAYLLFIPTMLALYVALRRESEATLAVATVLFLVGIIDFFATNTAFPVLALSRQHAQAATGAEQAMFLAAGEAMFALFNESAFLVSYVLVSAAWAMVSWVMARSPAFGRGAATSGVSAGMAGLAAVLAEHIPGPAFVLSLAIGLYFAAILLLLVWVLLVGRGLYRLGVG